jgi:hypothetical protein
MLQERIQTEVTSIAAVAIKEEAFSFVESLARNNYKGIEMKHSLLWVRGEPYISVDFRQEMHTLHRRLDGPHCLSGIVTRLSSKVICIVI